MATTAVKLRLLHNELQFLNSRGYRTPIPWRPARIFEDSPTCPKDAWSVCPHIDCALLDFVPEQRRREKIPCRHIPLNARGECLDSLDSTATNEEIAETLRQWLLSTIAKLEQDAQEEPFSDS